MTVLISESVVNVVPFMIIFFLWVILVATWQYNLKAYEDKEADFDGMPKSFVYFMMAFLNGIGNIEPPNNNMWKKSTNEQEEDEFHYSSHVVVKLIFIAWFFN